MYAVLARRVVRGYAVVETKSWRGCLRELNDRPGSAVLIEARQSEMSEVATYIQHVRVHFPRMMVIAAADRTSTGAAEILRECGCDYVFTSVFKLREMGGMVVRHLSSQPLPGTTLVEQLWQRLPWQAET